MLHDAAMALHTVSIALERAAGRDPALLFAAGLLLLACKGSEELAHAAVEQAAYKVRRVQGAKPKVDLTPAADCMFCAGSEQSECLVHNPCRKPNG